ncbi:MAG: hypothetical protein NVSMB9_02990 [Isosphaeraceae bacterium]
MCPRFYGFLMAATCLASCGKEPLDPFDQPSCESALNDPESIDAIDWLKTPSRHLKQVAGTSTSESLAFAETLAARGARRIVAVRVRVVSESPPLQHAEGLIIELPDEPGLRLALFRLYAQQTRAAGFSPRADTGQKYLFIASRQ